MKTTNFKYYHLLQTFLKKISTLISQLIDKILIIIKINSSFINKKNNILTYIILITLVTTIFIRLDFIIPIINSFLPYEIELCLRLTSALYSVLSTFISIVSIKSFFSLTVGKYKNKIQIENKTYYLYTLYFLYILLVNSILYIINYKSILSLNIDYLIWIYIFSSIISLIIGLYYIFYKFELKLDLNKTISLSGKICLFTFLIIYFSLFISLRTGVLFNYLPENNFIVKTILCESSDDMNNIFQKLKDSNTDKITSDDSKINLSNSSNISNTANTHAAVGNTNTQFIDNNNTGTISNVNNTQIPTPNNTNSTSITTSLKITKESSSNKEATKFIVEEELTTSFSKNSSNNSIEKLIKEGFGVFTNIKPMNQKSFESLKIQQPLNDSFSTLNRNFLGMDSNNSLNVIRPKTPSINTISSINDSPITIKSDTNINYLNNYPKSPTSTLNVDKKLPNIPSSETSTLNINKKLPDDFLKKNISELSLKNVDSMQTKKTSLRRIYSLPFIRKSYSESLIKHLDGIWDIRMDINAKNEIVIPNDIKNLNSNRLKLNNSYLLLDIVNNNVNSLLNVNSPQLGDIVKPYLWIEYDASKPKSKGFIFVEKNEISDYYNFEFIGAKNKYELVSYLNSDKHKIDGNFSKKNIVMKLTLKKNIEDKYLWSFTHWCTILNKNLKI